MPPSSTLSRVAPTRHERLAKLYDAEIYPLVARRFDSLLLHAAIFPPGAQVLEFGCGAGALTAELPRRLDGAGRWIATESSTALLDLARLKVAEARLGRHVFLRSHNADTKLPFSEDSFDTILARLVWSDLADATAVIRDLARVAKPGAQLIVVTPLRGTWGAFLDVFKEALQKQDRKGALEALEAYVASIPEPDQVAAAFAAAGLDTPAVTLESWQLLFRSGREFFFAPVIEHGPLSRWKDIAGRGPEIHDVFFAIKESIDTYFSGRAFAVDVYAGCFSATKGGAAPP